VLRGCDVLFITAPAQLLTSDRLSNICNLRRRDQLLEKLALPLNVAEPMKFWAIAHFVANHQQQTSRGRAPKK
jgi:hypothetical protein